jgi:hypothetical protein
LAGEVVVGVFPCWPRARLFPFIGLLAPLAAGSIGVEAPVAGHLLGGLGDVFHHPGDELQHNVADFEGSGDIIRRAMR